MNDLQNLFSSITGYEVNSVFDSARDEYYFELTNKEEKLEQLSNYADNVLNVSLSNKDIEKVYNAIETEKEDSYSWYVTYSLL